MDQVTGDAIKLERVHYRVKLLVDEFSILGTLTLFKGEKLIIDINHEKQFFELNDCEVKNKAEEVIAQPAKMIVNKRYVALLQVEGAE